MTDYETDIAHKRAVRALYVKSAQSLIKENITEARNPHLSADQVYILGEYRRKIAQIDKEMAIKMPTELVLQRLAWEDEAFNERQRLLKESTPIMKKIARQRKKVATSKAFDKHTERYLKAVEEDDNVLLLADEVVSQPSAYTSAYEADRLLEEDNIVEEFVTGALGRPSMALNNKLITAIKTRSAIRDVPIEDTQLLPTVPMHLP